VARAAAWARSRPRRALRLDRDVFFLRAGRGARAARDARMTGFGALAAGGLAWREQGEVVELSGLGDFFAQPALNGLLPAGPAAWDEAIAAARSHDGPRVPESDAR